jgi:L-ascorbate metabolism protein UlaG (beta-lactamase superfamily)
VAPGVSELTYVGHATVLVQLGGVRLLTDPLLRAGILHVRRRVPAPAIDGLGALDAVLISHAHHDHLDGYSLRKLSGQPRVIVPRGCASWVGGGGVPNVTEVDAGDRIPVGKVVVEAVPAAHDGRRYPFGRPVAALGYLLTGPCHVYFAGDTDLFADMSALAGRVHLALLPIWGWGSRVPAGHLDPVRAAEAVARIRPQIAVPIHWGTLRAWGAQRGVDPEAPARMFESAVRRVAPETTVQILMPGERMALPTGREVLAEPHDPIRGEADPNDRGDRRDEQRPVGFEPPDYGP